MERDTSLIIGKKTAITAALDCGSITTEALLEATDEAASQGPRCC